MAARKSPTKKIPTKKAATKKATSKPSAGRTPRKKGTTPKPNVLRATPAPPSKRTEKLIRFALTFPEAWVDHPWGEHVVKVKKKVFVFFGGTEEFGLAVKLPVSGPAVLHEPYAEPAGYGLGKSGWVTIKSSGTKIPDEQVEAWIEESYLAVAPKTLARRHLEGPGAE